MGVSSIIARTSTEARREGKAAEDHSSTKAIQGHEYELVSTSQAQRPDVKRPRKHRSKTVVLNIEQDGP